MALSSFTDNATGTPGGHDDPPEVRTLAERVFQQLQSAIVRGELAPGAKITEPGLAKAYGISRGPLREAMRRLEAHRLIERIPHVGARVVKLSMRELLELFDLREALESMAARLAARHMTATEIAGLRDVLAVHERQEDLQRDEAYFQREGDLDFHYCIVQGSHNRMLMTMLCDDLYYLVRLYRTQFSANGARPQRAFVEHHRIVDAIEAGDEELAELLMRRHVSASRENVAKHYAEALEGEAGHADSEERSTP
ncbi:GntR family transcriptional regulator [Chromohalobacter israelensis]|uniref:Transcriptional regulator, GntR family n=1 Tax=Chromohalobacter israelensis (strain ATCC BAA-138 / DSM 3043 / CIP 106854 / NCIMB 13768 / 1H11) TaxID=290398 RepID=Q1QUT9_CHRI1|nr:MULTISPECIES: GntR family transcriptional regulator [Chromohalobacter]ABE59769.1 transcriptional regulator, GntR family [Chromohalobacter salexigens DSM 3043]MDF9435668.1 GntR family transcriptional regulator [Chromohalobacter israelensis]MDO0947160.1 GntR family transcriptional regulator [Chromohalobacter salexigens]NWO57462.1 GntR family transcriptional regulator [Chromohalobacter salexigens]RXE48848.1 GntR family transcriptional regulator [Chromohalobacter salexigens]